MSGDIFWLLNLCRKAAKHTTMNRASPTTKGYKVQYVTGTTVGRLLWVALSLHIDIGLVIRLVMRIIISF